MAARNIPNNIPVRFIVFFIDVLLSVFVTRHDLSGYILQSAFPYLNISSAQSARNPPDFHNLIKILDIAS
jgi:hypothetical protein